VNHDLSLFDHTQAIASQFSQVDVVIDFGGSVGTREMLAAAQSVKLWQVLGTGLDHFDLNHWKSSGMPVAHCPGTLSAESLAEAAMMLMLMLAKRINEASALARSGHWFGPTGIELSGRRLGLVGFGASARELAARARAFGMTLAAIDIRTPTKSDSEQYGLDLSGSPELLDELLATSNFVSLHVPLTPETRQLIDRRRIALMPDTSYLINVARGALVDEGALVDALESGDIAGAGLDVFEDEPLSSSSPFMTLKNVVVTPHIAGATDATARRRAQLAAENCDRIVRNQKPKHLV